MRYFQQLMSKALGTRPGGAEAPGAVVLQHLQTGDYLAAGCRLASRAADAIVFESAAIAALVTSRFACEPDSFLAVPVPAELAA
jgi:hypothetical protein